MKIAERRRPKDRFDGITKGIDFNDHMRQFLQTVCTPNLASTERLTELKHWFAGRALTQVSQYLRSRDADSAFFHHPKEHLHCANVNYSLKT